MAIPAEGYPDRSRWLIAFGVLQLGFVLLLLACVARALSMPLPPQARVGFGRIQLALFPSAAAIATILAGIGSIRRKNWARILSIVLAAAWLAMGLLSVLSVVFFMPAMLARSGTELSSDSQSMVVWGIVALEGLFIVLVPAMFIAFYTRPSVRATCFAPGRQSPVRPVVVMVLAGWIALGTLWTGARVLFMQKQVAFLFGATLHGAPAAVMNGTVLLLGAWCAWQLWKQRSAGWWIGVGICVFGAASGVITIALRGVSGILEELNPSGEQVAFARQLPWFSIVPMVLLGVTMGVFVALLLYARRFYFPPVPPDTTGAL